MGNTRLTLLLEVSGPFGSAAILLPVLMSYLWLTFVEIICCVSLLFMVHGLFCA